MQNPNAVAHVTARYGVRASRILLLLGVFVGVPAAGPLESAPAESYQNAYKFAETLSPRLGAHALTPTWDEQFENLMRRLYKWWTCLEPLPGETPEQQMRRTTECYREHGIPTLPTPEEIEEIDKTIDEILNHTDAAPGTVGTSELKDFRDVLFEVKAKIG